jgi:hypothetical protein
MSRLTSVVVNTLSSYHRSRFQDPIRWTQTPSKFHHKSQAMSMVTSTSSPFGTRTVYLNIMDPMERCGNNSPRAARRCFGFGTTCDIVATGWHTHNGSCRRRTSFSVVAMEDVVVATGIFDGSLVSVTFIGNQ